MDVFRVVAQGPLSAPLEGQVTVAGAKNSALKLMAATSDIGRAFLTTPGVPAERLAALRASFDKMTKAPEFVYDAKRRRLGVDPMGGEELQALMMDVASQPQDVVDAMKKAVLPPGKE